MAKRGLHVNVYRVSGGEFRADLKLNTSPLGEGLTIRGTSEDDGAPMMMGSWLSTIKAKLSKSGQALSKARVLLQGILSNPALASAFPQYVGPSLVALSAMEQAEKHGILPTVKKKLTDPTLKKFAREMDEMSKGQRQAMSGGGICLACEEDIRDRGKRNIAALRGFMGAGSAPQSMRDPNPQDAKGWGLTMPHGGWQGMPFGLPVGNPHPFAEWVRSQITRGVHADPLMAQRLTNMLQEQRRQAKNGQ